MKQEVHPVAETGNAGGGEGVLHLACRATSHRCVQLCLQREVSVCVLGRLKQDENQFVFPCLAHRFHGKKL